MATVTILSSGTKVSSLKACVAYVLNEEKTKGCISFVGPINGSEINTDTVVKSFLEEQQNWSKSKGRTYLHSVLSFPPNEKISPDEVLHVAERLVTENSFYNKYQCLLAVHQDEDSQSHLHCHIVSNPVSYISGQREHHNTSDLKRLISETNQLCVSMGYSDLKPGFHYDGTKISEGDIVAADTKKYRVLMNREKHSYIAECAAVVQEVRRKAHNKDEFVNMMKQYGWDTNWSDNRKYITFSDGQHSFRNSNISKTFNLNLSKEALLYDFARTSRGETIESSEFYGTETDATDGTVSNYNSAGNLQEAFRIGNEVISYGASVATNAIKGEKQKSVSQKSKQKKGDRL